MALQIPTPAQRLGIAALLSARKDTKSAVRRCERRATRAMKEINDNRANQSLKDEATQWIHSMCRVCGKCKLSND